MFYELQAKINETNPQGKSTTATHKYLTECELYAEAEHAILQQHANNETYSITKSKLKEIVNSQQGEDKAFVATLQQEYDIDGKKSAMKYDVLVFAPDFDMARQTIKDYLRQDYTDMELVKLSESKIEAVL